MEADAWNLEQPNVVEEHQATFEEVECLGRRGDQKLMLAAEPLHERAYPRRVPTALATEADHDSGHVAGPAGSCREPHGSNTRSVFDTHTHHGQL